MDWFLDLELIIWILVNFGERRCSSWCKGPRNKFGSNILFRFLSCWRYKAHTLTLILIDSSLRPYLGVLVLFIDALGVWGIPKVGTAPLCTICSEWEKESCWTHLVSMHKFCPIKDSMDLGLDLALEWSPNAESCKLYPLIHWKEVDLKLWS